MTIEYNNCKLCPHECKVDRNIKVGICGASDKCEVAKIMLHHFEEPFLSGESDDNRGSGTVFFGHCNLKCVYCQNYQISRCALNTFKTYSSEELKVVFLQLQKDGAYNINLVTPTQYLPTIIDAILKAKKDGLTIPIVYNTSGYEQCCLIKELKGIVDIFLTDFKYFDDDLAKAYSNVSHYQQIAKDSLCEMVKLTGGPKFDKNGFMKSGTVVRHLALPTHLQDSKNILKLLHETFKNKIFISIMNQYTVTSGLDKEKYPQLNKKLSKKSYENLIDYAVHIGITKALVQENGTAKESFIPQF